MTAPQAPEAVLWREWLACGSQLAIQCVTGFVNVMKTAVQKLDREPARCQFPLRNAREKRPPVVGPSNRGAVLDGQT